MSHHIYDVIFLIKGDMFDNLQQDVGWFFDSPCCSSAPSGGRRWSCSVTLVLCSGVLQGVRDDARRPGHARDLRRVAQHRQGGGAHGGRAAAHAAAAPQGHHPRLPPPPPTHPRGLPGECQPGGGASEAPPPGWPSAPFQLTGQPVLIGGTMGTCSYVLTGTERGMTETFGTTCHGAVTTSCP